ncbi:tyrosinase family protein [Nostoc sp. FACHB-152]|uniref:tyrosinase family protein n=1 Tax=unclassified Nostoc TaxID=2593658 RepID=UPI0016827B38|nr:MULTISPECIES: tyrosinase family protein [unclassified Nostoc]MBD2447485.1 tyrosinase family protein [Nostoc sp. FACHB-152]MBD2468295.1 tyrosinase family protein [Nostoc sp. FACHB-145]
MKILQTSFKVLISSIVATNAIALPAFAHNSIDHTEHKEHHETPQQHTHLKVRKSVTSLTSTDKQALVNAIKTLKNTTLPGNQISIYDQFIAIHLGATRLIHNHEGHSSSTQELAHENTAFLPWHREYINRFEEALQNVDSTVTLPYWDWTDAEALDVIFNDDFLSPNGQGVTINIPKFGSFTGGPVQSGAFSVANGWVLNPQLNFDPTAEKSLGTSLVRFLRVPPASDYPLPQRDIDRVMAINDYSLFRTALEGFITVDEQGKIIPGGFTHNYIHGLVGGVQLDLSTRPVSFKGLGTMSNIPSSPYDPVFWLHHANVDRLWAEWQEDGHQGSLYYPADGQPYGHNLNDLMWPWDDGMSTPKATKLGDLLSLLPDFDANDLVRPVDVLDYKKLGYTYDTLQSVPESGSIFALCSLAAMLVISRQKRHTNSQLTTRNSQL